MEITDKTFYNNVGQVDQETEFMCRINVYEAKTNLSKYLGKLENGEEKEIIISRYGKKIAKITLYEEDKKKKRLGAAIGILPKKPFSLEDVDEEIAKSFGY